jgi:Type-IV b secretion system, inner-membrane complex component
MVGNFDVSSDDVINTYNDNQGFALKAQRNLVISIILGIYTVIITSWLVLKSSGNFDLITFLNDKNGSVNFIVPHLNPPVTDRQAIHWAKDKAIDLLSLHFKKYPEQIARRKNYFVGDGWALYQKSLIDNKVIEKIKSEGLIITAVSQSTPKLLQKYSLDGKINWRIEIVVLQTIQGASDIPLTVKKRVSVTVEQTRRDDAIEAMKIRIFGIID